MIKPPMPSSIHGLYAAVLTPRDGRGLLDLASFEQQLTFLTGNSIAGFAVNGATGEYPGTSVEEMALLLNSARRAAPQSRLLCGIGASNLAGTLARGEVAIAGGAQALLLPMPYFFPYRQDDLIAFVSEVADRLAAPLLLYNLPQFTSGLEPATVVSLLQRCANILGVKDSSGSLDMFRLLKDSMPERTRMIGNDGALAAALQGNMCHGVISGVACVLPELMQRFFTAPVGEDVWLSAQSDLEEVIQYLDLLPTPWGLKALSIARGILRDQFPLPLSPERRATIAAMQRWWTHRDPEWDQSARNPQHSTKAVAQ